MMKFAPTPIPASQRPSDKRSIDADGRFHLLVDCRNEPTQKRLYEQLTAQGLKCRVLVL